MICMGKIFYSKLLRFRQFYALDFQKNKMENPYNGPSAFMVQVETNKWLTEHGGHP